MKSLLALSFNSKLKREKKEDRERDMRKILKPFFLLDVQGKETKAGVIHKKAKFFIFLDDEKVK